MKTIHRTQSIAERLRQRQQAQDAEDNIAAAGHADVILGLGDEPDTCTLCHGGHELKDCPIAKQQAWERVLDNLHPSKPQTRRKRSAGILERFGRMR